MGWFGKQVRDAIRNILTDIKEALLGFANDIFEALLNPIVGVPAPESNSRYIVVGTPENAPWQSLYADFYLQYILPLTIMLLIVGFAYIGLRSGSISPYRRKRLLRRIGLVFMGSFVWFPLVSIRSSSSMRSDSHLLQSTICRRGVRESHRVWCRWPLRRSRHGSRFELPTYRRCPRLRSPLAGHPRANAIDAVTRRLLGTRRVAHSVRPRRSHAAQPASIQDSCLRDFPAAVLFRIGWQMNLTASADGLFSLFLGLVLIPAACLASIMTVYWSALRFRQLLGRERAKRIRWLPPRQRNQARENLFVVPGTCIGDTPRTKLAR